jgi:heme-degrading monooxygenase HmoA
MTTIGMHYDVIPGKEEEFEKGFLNVLEHLKSVDGHVESHMYEDVAVLGSYVIMSEWKSQEAFTEFLRSDAFKQVTAWGKAEILRGRPKHKVYTSEAGSPKH